MNRKTRNQILDTILILCTLLLIHCLIILGSILLSRYTTSFEYLNHTYFTHGTSLCKELGILIYTCT